ncbi:MAG: hypothetical protein HXS54_10735 [Theionarchaea archaeon]|nr:hypothetical protein [Theionarchaea archaeon]
MDTREMLDTIYSFVSGFGKREIKDGQNAIFIAKELFNLDLPLKFKGMGRVGVECLRLYFTLEDAKPSRKNRVAYNAGRMLSKYSSRELMLMALYLWNKGRSSLTVEEREEARILLEKWDAPGEKLQSAAVSG